MDKKNIIIYICLLLAMAFWSLSFVWYKLAYESFGPITVIFARLIISSAFLFLMAVPLRRFQKIEKKEFKYFILLAFFEPFLYFMGESFGIKYVSSTLAAVIVSTIPLFTPIVAYYFYKEKLTFLNFIGIFISIIGVVMVVFYKGFDVAVSVRGIALMFLAVFAAVGYSVLVKKLVDKYNPIMIVAYQNLIGMLFFTPLFLILEVKSLGQVNISQRAVISVIELAVFASSFAFILFTYAVRKIGVAKATIFSNAIPAFTAVFAFFIIKESITIIKFIGIAIVILGLLLSQLRRKKRKHLFLDDGQNLSC